ncbi:MAG: hypothetical protein QXW42_04150 [Thermofilum sp.]
MRQMMIWFGIVVMVFSIFFVNPVGMSFVETYRIQVMMDVAEFKVPEHLVEKGYPEEVKVSKAYVLGEWSGREQEFLTAVFRNDTVYDPQAGRAVSPEEVREGYVIGGGNSVREVKTVAWSKAGVFAIGLMLAVAGLASGSRTGERERYEKVVVGGAG